MSIIGRKVKTDNIAGIGGVIGTVLEKYRGVDSFDDRTNSIDFYIIRTEVGNQYHIRCRDVYKVLDKNK